MALRNYVWYLGRMIKRADPWNNRSAISRWAHVFERIGLALAGGFYLGIDLPSAPPDHRLPLPLKGNLGSRADAVELLSAAGTFLAAVAAVVSVSGIVLDEAVRTSTARLIILAWAIGTTMQIAAGIMVRMRADTSTTS